MTKHLWEWVKIIVANSEHYVELVRTQLFWEVTEEEKWRQSTLIARNEGQFSRRYSLYYTTHSIECREIFSEYARPLLLLEISPSMLCYEIRNLEVRVTDSFKIPGGCGLSWQYSFQDSSLAQGQYNKEYLYGVCDVIDTKYLTSLILMCHRFRLLSEQICKKFDGNFLTERKFWKYCQKLCLKIYSKL